MIKILQNLTQRNNIISNRLLSNSLLNQNYNCLNYHKQQIRLFSSTTPENKNLDNLKKQDNNNSNNNNNNNNNSNDNEGVDKQKYNVITWSSVLVALVAGAGGWLYYDHLMSKKKEKQNQIVTYGSSSIGGGYSLIDENGKAVSDLDFRGKYVLLYFGFTYCPDACPAELTKISQVLTNLEKTNLMDGIQPVFITIDPWRDTVEQIRTYVKEFHPKFKALTGTPEQITKVAKLYRVFMSKAGQGDSYLVDHTIITYLIGPDGKFIEFYGSNLNSDQITERVIKRIADKGQGGENKGEIRQEKSVFEQIMSIFSK
ncbi:hypothetical protein DLAC_09010 [Tieghemostelium lacteum]|uniref:Thioredoxin domain-containing protein n=1 Tax=Tieghemostelium lacteum TaxID=361077 RepID=A0A151Z8V0_TIELA|nr:hypothetical protein DLAC_09010 [Tieghemostelium lacteum]|eukprot:KYQ90393.1 hypothetical protein DLAC_09010 [Tieghemostelium lacteum]